jgi:hypothetical protein
MPIVCASAAFTPLDEFHSDFFHVDHKRPEEHHFTGQEQGIVEQTYFLDDEPTYDSDLELDALAYRDWRQAEIEEIH